MDRKNSRPEEGTTPKTNSKNVWRGGEELGLGITPGVIRNLARNLEEGSYRGILKAFLITSSIGIPSCFNVVYSYYYARY